MTIQRRVGMIAGVTIARRTTSARPRQFRAALAAVLVGLIAALAVASPASAHASLVSTTPAANDIVKESPAQVLLTFSEKVTPVAGKVRVIAPDGTRADTGDIRVSDDNVVIPMKAGPQGTYLVTYRVLSADSHPVAGSYTFSVGAVSTPPTANESDVQPNGFITTAFPVVRWIGWVGLLLMVGAVLVLALLWPKRLDRKGPIRLIYLGAGAIALATVLELALEVPYVAGGGLGDIRSTDIQAVLSSQFGAAHLVRLGVLIAALLLIRPIVRGKGWGADRVLLAVLAMIGIATWSISGHPSSTPVPLVTVVADMIHIASMSVWLGGLAMLLIFLMPKATAVELGAIIPVWSRWATYAVAALVVTGVTQALVEIGTVDAIFTTRYGWLVAVKVLLVLVILGVASFTRRLVAPIAARSDGSVGKLRGLIIAEAAVAVVVLGVTSVLVQTTPARTAIATTPGEPTIQAAVLKDPLFTLTVDLSPARVGINDLHLYASTPDGKPADVKEWTVKASLPSAGIEPIQADIIALKADHATGQISLVSPGTWTFTFTLRTSEIDQSTVTTEFVVRS